MTMEQQGNNIFCFCEEWFWGLKKICVMNVTCDMLAVICGDKLCDCCGTDVSSLGQTSLYLVPFESVASAVSIDNDHVRVE